MPEALLLLLVVLALSVVFDFINGFHDTANAIATVVATRVLTPLQAILMAAILNFAGALTGTKVAKTIQDMVSHATMQPGILQQVIIAALLAAITWNLITWYYGIPSSSSHALIGGLVGAATVQAGVSGANWHNVMEKAIVPLVISPLVGFAISWVFVILLLRGFMRRTPSSVQHTFGKLQLVSSAFMAFSHGGNDAQKTMGVMTLALASYQGVKELPVPVWVKMLAAIAMGFGTAVGGWRVIKTMGHKITRLEPIHGFAAETAAATVIEIASRLGFPLSTTHVISASIMGVGASRRLSAVRWSVAGSIVTAWILTIPTCMILSGLAFLIVHAL